MNNYLIILVSLFISSVSFGNDNGFLKTSYEEEFYWDKDSFPIVCHYDNSVTSKDLSYYERAREIINNQIGEIVFSTCFNINSNIGKSNDFGHIIISMVDKFTNDKTIGYGHPLRYENSPKIIKGYVYIKKSHSHFISLWVHELGHVLGLAHDDIPSSVMYTPFNRNRPERFTDDDVERLRKKYFEENNEPINENDDEPSRFGFSISGGISSDIYTYSDGVKKKTQTDPNFALHLTWDNNNRIYKLGTRWMGKPSSTSTYTGLLEFGIIRYSESGLTVGYNFGVGGSHFYNDSSKLTIENELNFGILIDSNNVSIHIQVGIMSNVYTTPDFRKGILTLTPSSTITFFFWK